MRHSLRLHSDYLLKLAVFLFVMLLLSETYRIFNTIYLTERYYFIILNLLIISLSRFIIIYKGSFNCMLITQNDLIFSVDHIPAGHQDYLIIITCGTHHNPQTIMESTNNKAKHQLSVYEKYTKEFGMAARKNFQHQYT